MNKFSKKDLIFSVVTGFYTGFIFWKILVFLGLPAISVGSGDYFVSFSSRWFIVIVPVLWILGVNLGYFLGKWAPFFNQFGKYSAIGFTNAAVYFGILNLMIAGSGVIRGLWYSVFVAVAFFVGTVHSFFWNKYWAFESRQGGSSSREFGKFIVISIIAGVINVGVASLIVNGLDPMLGLSEETWANVGGIAGSAVALIFSFVGFRLVVFKNQ